MPLPLSGSPLLIAEAKRYSPWDGDLGRSFEDSFELAATYGDLVSVLAHWRWHPDKGKSPAERQDLAWQDLIWARQQTDKPLLAKGMFTEESQIDKAFDLGADYALAYNFVPKKNPDRAFVELAHLGRLSLLHAKLTVINSRDMETGQPKAENLTAVHLMMAGAWWCQASFVKELGDVHQGANAVIVGTDLPRFVEPLEPAPVLPRELWP